MDKLYNLKNDLKPHKEIKELNVQLRDKVYFRINIYIAKSFERVFEDQTFQVVFKKPITINKFFNQDYRVKNKFIRELI